MERLHAENPKNLKKMVVLSETKTVKTSKLILNHAALRFKENIEFEINLIQSQITDNTQILNKTKTLGRSKDAGVKAGARYECIYKNFLRDIRQYYSGEFVKFLKGIDNPYKKNLQYKYLLFPYFTL